MIDFPTVCDAHARDYVAVARLLMRTCRECPPPMHMQREKERDVSFLTSPQRFAASRERAVSIDELIERGGERIPASVPCPGYPTKHVTRIRRVGRGA